MNAEATTYKKHWSQSSNQPEVTGCHGVRSREGRGCAPREAQAR